MFAHDCALMAHSLQDTQITVEHFAHASGCFGLTISLKTIKVMYQPVPGHPLHDPVITIDITHLNAVSKFCYLGSILTNNAQLDEEITQRLSKASSAFGRLQHRLWKDHWICLATKVKVYQAAVLTSLLYSCKTWTLNRHHIKQLDAFHLPCLCSIWKIKWQNKISNMEVLAKCDMLGIEL